MRTKKTNAAAAAGETHPPVPFSTYADHIETLSAMLEGGGPMEALNCADLGAFISNHGTKEEIAEVMLTMVSVGGRVFLRYDAAKDACLAEARAAAKGEKK